MNDLQKKNSIRRFVSDNRIYVLLIVVFLLMAPAPNFLTELNLTTILKGASTNALPAIGFTIVLIAGGLDLSIGTTLTLGGMVTIALQPHLGWPVSIVAAMLAGAAVGTANGLLVAKAKVDSFIATLGAMIITRGLVYIICGGGTLTVSTFQLADFLETPFAPLLTPRILIAIASVIAFEIFLQKTPPGRNFYLVGANASTAWHAGLSVDRYKIAAFVISGTLAALAGAISAISLSSAMPTMGDKSLMFVVAAVIIGGTSMAGGKGSVLKSMIALIVLKTLFAGFGCIGAGWEIQQIASGIVLASVILYDAAVVVRKERTKGQRHELLEELKDRPIKLENEERDPAMERRDLTLVCLTGIAVTACVAIVAIFAMYFMHISTVPQPVITTVETTDNLIASLAVDTSELKSMDNQPLILPPAEKVIPARPDDPSALPEEDALHWYDLEYSGWNVEKVNMPTSPADGARGKKVTHLLFVDHPYHTARKRGMQKIADAYGIEVKRLVANDDINIQDQQVDQVINEKPDFVIIDPVDAKACVPLFRRLNEAGIPFVASNLMPISEAQKYCLAWSGPDDWGQFRKLAHDFAKRMNYKGGYCIVRHYPGGSPFFARTFAVITELKKIAPEMKLLDMQPTDLEAEKTMQVVSDWITRFGDELNGIVSADDSGAQIGINEAVRNANREDIVRVAAGNSKVGMNFIKDGTLHAITYQSPEADGAIPMQLAADWLNGKEIPAIRYLPIRIITKENVDQYLPAQW